MTRRTPLASQVSMPHGANPAAQLHRDCHSIQDGGDRVGIDWPAGEGAIQIHHMQPGEAGILPGARLGGGVGRIHRGIVHLAPAEPHALTILQVYRGIKRQRRHCALWPRRRPGFRSRLK